MFKPFNDNVVVRIQKTEDVSDILIPESVKETPSAGKVIAIGPGRYESGVRILMNTKIGQLVVWARGQETKVKFGGDEYYIIAERNLLTAVEED